MITVTCPTCSSQYELPDEDAGTQAACACGQVLDVVPDATGVASGVVADGLIPVVCDACGGRYELGLEDAGTQVECPCGKVLTVPAPGAAAPAAPATIAVTCSGCASHYELAAEDAGSEVQCGCGQVIVVPSAGATGQDTAQATWSGPIPVTCQSCGANYELPPEDAGTQAECGCGQVLDIPLTPPPAGPESSNAASIADVIPLTCTACGAAYELAAEAAGTQVECACGTVLDVPHAPATAPEGRRRKKRSQKRKIEIQKPEKPAKKNSWLASGLIGGGSLVLIIALIYVVNRSPASRPAGTAEQTAVAEIPPGKVAADPTTWQGWVSETTAAVVIVRPKQMLQSKLLAALPLDALVASAQSAAGVEPAALEEVVFVVDPPADGAAEPTPLVFLKFAERTDRRRLVSSLLPDGQPVSTKAGTWFRGATGGIFFPNDHSAVLADAALLEASLPKLRSRYLPDNPLFQQIEDAARSNDVDAFVSEAALKLLPEDAGEVAGQITSLTFSLSFSGSSLIDALIATKDAAAAEATEKQLNGLKTTLAAAVDQFAGQLPVGEGQTASLGPTVKSLIEGIKVYRTEASLNVQLRAPYNLGDSLKQAAPQLMALTAMLPGAGSATASTDSTAGGSGSAPKPKAAVAAMKPASKFTLPTVPKESFRVYDKAYDRFIEIYTESEELKTKMKEAEEAERPDLRGQRKVKLAEAAGVLRAAERLAVRLAEATGDREKLLQSRYLLAYVYTELNLHYEAGLLGNYVARMDAQESKRAVQAGFLSLMSWQNAYQEAPGNYREGERDEFVRAAALLDERWNDDPQLDRIRYSVGQVLQIDRENEAAGDWFAKVGAVAEEYAEAQIAAGQSYWREYKAVSKEARAWRKEHEAQVPDVIQIDTTPEPEPAQEGSEPTDEPKPATSAGDPEPKETSQPQTEATDTPTPSPVEKSTDEPPAAAPPPPVESPTSADAPASTDETASTRPDPEPGSAESDPAESVREATEESDPPTDSTTPTGSTAESTEGGDDGADPIVSPESAPNTDTASDSDLATDPYTKRLDRLLGLSSKHLEKGVGLMQASAPRVLEIPESEKPDEPAAEPATEPAAKPAAKPTAAPAAANGADPAAEETPDAGPKVPPAPDSIIAGKLSLAEIRLRLDNGAGAMELLTAEPWSVMTAITVEDESARPAKGTQSRAFATAAYQLLLRATVSERQLDQARIAMQQLEAIAGANDAARLTAVYVQLGTELMEELEAADETRAASLSGSFAEFLSVMSEREQQTFGSLLWIAETSTALADAATEPEQSREFHARAVSAYDSIIEQAGKDRKFCSARTVSAIRIRIAKSLGRAGQYERAVQVFAGQLTLQPNSYSMQFDAARVFQDWGANTDDKDRLLEAISGRGESLWGWGRISITLQRRLESDNAKPEYREMMLEARYHVAQCRRQWALSQTDKTKKTEGLEKGLQAIRTTAQIADSLEGEWWDRLDELYQTIQRDLGQTPESIRAQVSAISGE